MNGTPPRGPQENSVYLAGALTDKITDPREYVSEPIATGSTGVV